VGVRRFGCDILRQIVIACAVVFLVTSSAFGIDLWRPDGKIRFLSESELAFHPTGDEWYTESWNLNYIDENGLYYVLCIAISNLGPGDNKANALLIVSTPDGRRGYARTDYFTFPKLVAATDRWYVGFGDVSVIKRKNEISVKFKWEKFELNAKYEPFANPLTLGSGFTYFDRKNYISEFVQIPAGRVKGTLKFGEQTFRLDGFGFADHQRSNAMTNKYYDYYTSFNSFSGKSTVHFMENAAYDGRNQPVQILYVTDDDRVLFAVPAYKFKITTKTVDSNRGFVMPEKIEFEAQDGDWEVRGVIENKKLLDELDIRSQLKPFERFLASLAGKFFVYRWFAKVAWAVTGPGYNRAFESNAAEFEIGYFR